MFEHVFHPTDFSRTSEVAFAHGLKIALAGRPHDAACRCAGGHGAPPHGFPRVRRTMAAWGLVGADCRPDDVARLGVRIKKLEIEAHDPTEAIADYLEARQMDLVVLATHQRGGLARWMRPPVAEPVVMTTRGPEGFLGALRGSTSSTIIRKCRCPVLAVPRA